VADSGNHSIRQIAASQQTSTLAGVSGTFGTADGTGNLARFTTPKGIAIDGTTTLYVADTGNSIIRKDMCDCLKKGRIRQSAAKPSLKL
jgi:hypothetical protein